MDITSIINILLIAGVLQGFGFIIITLMFKKKFPKLIIYLLLVVLFISFNNLQAWLIDKDYISPNFILQNFKVPWYLLIFPMFYAFTTHFLRIEEKVKDFIQLTLSIFVLELVLKLCLISFVYHEIPGQDTSIIDRYNNLEEIINILYCMFLFINACILVFRKHEMLNYILAFDDISWIKTFMKLGGLVILLWVVAILSSNLYGNEFSYYPLRLGSSVLLYWIGYQGIYKYHVVEDRIFLRKLIDENRVLIDPSHNSETSLHSDISSNEKHVAEFQKIRNFIIKEKLYLEPLLSQENLAETLGMSTSHFSKLINGYSGFNFSDLINSLRVEQAKKFLRDDEFSDYTIVAIGLECGFNSKSTFYSAFKKFTMSTPSDFKEQMKNR